MNIKNKKTKISTISLILILTLSAVLIILPTTIAQVGNTKKTFPFINALPNPVGIGQEVLIHIGITHPLALQPQGWEDITVTVTKPDNSIVTLGPFRTDSTGGTGTTLFPDLVGTWSLQMHFPEQLIPTGTTAGGGGAQTPTNTTMLASDSVVLELNVQADPILRHPASPLPTEYWTRPIDAQLREWITIAGSDMKPGRTVPRNAFLPYNDPPETAHVLWTKAYTSGGLVGGGLGDPTIYDVGEAHSFEIGDAYEGKWNDAIIVGGRGYYREWETVSRTQGSGAPYTAVDLRTGEVLWTKTFLDNRTIAFGQMMYWDTYDFHGVYDYLIVPVSSGFFGPSNWHFFDAQTGNYHYTLADVPASAGSAFGPPNWQYGPKGEFLFYDVDLNNGWMALWNSTNIPSLRQSTTPGTMGWGQWRPFGKTVEAQGNVSGPGPNNPTGLNGYQWNVTIPDLPGGVRVVLDDRIIGSTVNTGTDIDEITNWGISLKPGQEGTLLFNNTWTAPAELKDVVVYFEGSTNYGEDGIIYYGARELTKFYAFSTETGAFLWETEAQIDLDSDAYLNWYGWTQFQEKPTHIAYGKLLASGIAGIVYAYDIETGELAWKYKAEDPYSEFLFNNNWWLWPLFITDGKIYYGHLEHSPISPRPRGAPFLALDIETGEEVFRVNGMFRQSLWGGTAVMGDSVILTQDTYDQRVYVVGKGPSATTVEIQNDAIQLGRSAMVKGTVMDVSPGTKDPNRMLRFSTGVPAVSDQSQSEWMLYVYKQFPRPTDATGVQVRIQIYDPNGNFAWIGTATSDSYGNYAYSFIPQMKGMYAVIATFVGSEAYFGSTQMTYLQVEDAPAPYPTTPPYPGYQGPSAQDVANNVVNSLPADPTPTQIGDAVVNQLPPYPQPTVVPEYTTMDIVIIILVAVAIIIGLVSLFRKQK